MKDYVVHIGEENFSFFYNKLHPRQRFMDNHLARDSGLKNVLYNGLALTPLTIVDEEAVHKIMDEIRTLPEPQICSHCNGSGSPK